MFSSRAENGLSGVSHRGANVHSVVALAPSNDIVAGHTLVFLDFRQIAAPAQFVMLPSEYLAYVTLDGLLPRQPPKGWRLSVLGGKRRRHYFKVRHGETLCIGFVHEQQVEDELLSESLSDDDSDGDQPDDHDEDEAGDDAEPTDDDDDDSQTSTRSRSRHAHERSKEPSPSSDRSFNGTLLMKSSGKELLQGCESRTVVDLAMPLLNLSVHSWGFPLSWTRCKGLSVTIREFLPRCCKVPEARPGPSIFNDPRLRDARLRALLDTPPGERMPRGIFVPAHDLWRPPPGPEADILPQHVDVLFLVFTPDYAPSAITVPLRLPIAVAQALAALQSARPALERSRFGRLVPVHMQPAFEYGCVIALPEWATGTYVLMDLLKVNGGLFCSFVAPVLNRSSLLVIAGLDRGSDVIVFIADRPEPLRDAEDIALSTGFCVTFVPRAQAPFAAASLEDLLQDPRGWDTRGFFNGNAPGILGRWMHILCDGEPSWLQVDPPLNMPLRTLIAATIERPVDGLTVQVTRPRIADYYDRGYLAQSVVAATDIAPLGESDPDKRVIYFIDLRPILCDLSWGFAPFGRVAARPMVDILDARSPAGFRTQISGGRPIHTDDGLFFGVDPGTVLIVDFVPREVFSSDTEESHHSDDSMSSSDSSSDSDTDGPPTNPPPCQGSGTGEAPHDHANSAAGDSDTSGVSSCAAWLAVAASFLRLFGTVQNPGASPSPTCVGSAAPCPRGTKASCRPTMLFLAVLLASLVQLGATVQVPKLGHYQAEGARHTARRYVPTPCRSRVTRDGVRQIAGLASPSQLHHEDTSAVLCGPICTLLEESLADPACCAFGEARALLEVLEEHFADRPHPDTCEVEAGRCLLSLEATIPAPASLGPTSAVQDWLPLRGHHGPEPQVSIGDTKLGFTWHQLWTLTDAKVTMTVWDEGHPHLRQLYNQLPAAIDAAAAAYGPCDAIIFTDGSFTPGTDEHGPIAGWATVLVQPHQRWVGTAHGSVPFWALGCQEALSAYAAECFALTLALLISAVEFPDMQFVFCSDCVSALYGAAGRYACGTGGVAQAMSSAAAFRRGTSHARDNFVYVPGHQGHFFNEAADLLAKAGAAMPETASCLSLDEAQLGLWLGQGAPLLPWAGLAVARLLGDHSLPPLQGQDLGHDCFHEGLSTEDMLQPFVPHSLSSTGSLDTGTPQRFNMKMRVLSFNTLSLGACLEDDDGRGTEGAGLHQRPARAALLAKQLRDLSIAVAALQETRSPQGSTVVGGYLRFAGGADRGHLALSFGFAKAMPS